MSFGSTTAAIIGSTGLIGSQVLELLLNDKHFSSIKIIVRRPLSIDHPKARVVVIDFADDAAFKQAVSGSGAVFCAVGTTQQKVKGNKEAYRKVDYDIPVHAARFCAEAGVGQFLLVSSVGADSNSNNFYLKLKGEVEDAVKRMNIPSVSIFRPSVLLGKRQESRPGEKIAQVLMPVFSFLIPSKYKPIKAYDVARTMVAAAKQGRPGFNVYHYREMMDLLR